MRLRFIFMFTRNDHERAIVGAMLLDHRVARLLLAELDHEDFEDVTCLAVLWALRHQRTDGEDLAELDTLWAVAEGCMPAFRPADTVAKLLGMPEEVAALVQDRSELRDALAAGLRAVGEIGPVGDEPMVVMARELLNGGR